MRPTELVQRIRRRHVALLGVAVLAALLVGPWWMAFVRDAGQPIPTSDVGRDYLIGLAWAGAVAFVLLRLPVPERDRRALGALWLAKVAVALGLMLLYEGRYSSLDAYGYFSTSRGPFPDSSRLWDGTVNVARLAWLQTQVLPDSYHALKVTFAALGLVGIYGFYKAAARFLGREDLRVLYFLALFPSVLFWSSILGKEPLVLFGLGLLAWGGVALYQGRRGRSWAMLLAGCAVLALLRAWMLAIAIVPLAVLAFAALWRSEDTPRRHAAVLVAAVGLVASPVLLMGLFDVYSPGGAVAFVNGVARAWAFGGSGEAPPDFLSVKDLLAFLPSGAFTALFRPLPGEVTQPLLFGIAAGLENALLLGLVALAVLRTRLRELRDPVVGAALLFVAVWTALYAFISYQNLGTAVRFRLQVLPVLLGLALWLGRPRPGTWGAPWDARLARLGRGPLRVADALLAAVVLPAAGLAVLALGLRRRVRPEARGLLALDTSYTLHEIRTRGLEHSVTSRDLDRFFDHVWTVHPLVGASRQEPAQNAFGPASFDDIAPRHTFVQGRVGRYAELRDFPRLNFALAQAQLLFTLHRLLRSGRIAVVRASDPYWPGLLALLLTRVHRLPLVVRVGGNYDAIYAALGTPAYPRLFRRRGVEKWVERLVFPRADLVAGANEDNLRYAVANGARPERTTVFRYGPLIDPVHFEEPAERPVAKVREELGLGGARFLVYVGRLEAVKSPDDVVRVLAALQKDHPELKAVLVGDGRLRPPVQALAARLGVGDALRMPGNRDQAWIAACFAAATVVVSPHMGRALVEAALSGTPIVAYDRDWQAELVRTGETGIVVPDRDWKAMADAVGALLADREAAHAMGARGREAAKRVMDPAALMAHERGAYEALLAPRPGLLARWRAFLEATP